MSVFDGGPYSPSGYPQEIASTVDPIPASAPSLRETALDRLLKGHALTVVGFFDRTGSTSLPARILELRKLLKPLGIEILNRGKGGDGSLNRKVAVYAIKDLALARRVLGM